MNLSMTAMALARRYVENWNMQSEKTRFGTQTGHVNPYEDPWMDITNRSPSEWQRIISVDQDVADQIRSMVREDFVKRYGMTDGSPEHVNDRSNLIKQYTKTLPGEQRLPATWTLEQIISQEAERLKEITLEKDPSWTYGKPFDPSILEQESSKSHFEARG